MARIYVTRDEQGLWLHFNDRLGNAAVFELAALLDKIAGPAEMGRVIRRAVENTCEELYADAAR